MAHQFRTVRCDMWRKDEWFADLPADASKMMMRRGWPWRLRPERGPLTLWRRYRAERPIVLTTNLPPAELAERLGPRTMSRLSEMGVGLHLDGPDRRRMKGVG